MSSAGSGYGVYGYCDGGTGLQGGSSSGTGAYVSSVDGIGLDGNSSSNIAVRGTAGTSTGVHGSSSSGYGVHGQSPTNYAVIGVTTSGTGAYGQASAKSQAGVAGRTHDASGNFAIFGFGNFGVSGGTKSALVPALWCSLFSGCWSADGDPGDSIG